MTNPHPEEMTLHSQFTNNSLQFEMQLTIVLVIMSALEILQSIQKSAEWLIYSLLLRNPVILFHKWNFHVILTRVTHWA